jgi:hypothetical protein
MLPNPSLQSHLSYVYDCNQHSISRLWLAICLAKISTEKE